MVSIPHIDLPPLATHESSAMLIRAVSINRSLWRFSAEHVLGTSLEILIHTPHPVLATRAVQAVLAEIKRLDQVFNHRRVDSELSRLNASKNHVASEDLFAVVHLAETWRHISRGAFDGRMGAQLNLWATPVAPDTYAIERARADLQRSVVALSHNRSIKLSAHVVLSLDAIAKGYIVDAALTAACRAAPAVNGLAVNIGGDIRCWGEALHAEGWRIGIPDPMRAMQNAPLLDAVSLRNAAIATSGRGPRDRCADGYRSTTISPLTGQPVAHVISATAVATHAADADAIATACLVLDPAEGIALVDRIADAAVRITDLHGRVHHSSRWPSLQMATVKAAQGKRPAGAATSRVATDKSESTQQKGWPADWELGITYTEPEYKDRAADFRSPFIVVWITDADNKPISTLFMLGRDPKWHRDNFVWWRSHDDHPEAIVDMRSQSTTLSGRYQMYWGGTDDNYRPVPIGEYILHLETSQEHGKHTYRTVPLTIGRERFKLSLPNLIESGGLQITYGHYNDRFVSE